MQFGVEGAFVDLRSGVVFFPGGGQVFELPDIELFVLSSGGDEVAIGSDAERVNVSVVGLEGVFDGHFAGPDLDFAVPSDRGEIRFLFFLGLAEGRISQAGNPISMVIVLGAVLQYASGVPKLDIVFGSGAQDHTGIVGEGDGVDFFGVSGELLTGDSLVQIPKSEGSVPA